MAGDYPRYNRQPVFKKIESLYQGRINQFTDPNGEYKRLNLAAHYDRARVGGGDNVRVQVYSVPDLARPSFKKVIKEAEWQPTEVGQSFGPSWSTHWFKIEVRLPENWSDYKESPILDFDSSDEGFVYTEDGVPLVGLSAEHNRREWILPSDWQDGDWHTFYIETAANNIQGNNTPPDENRYFRLNTVDLVVPNGPARALHIDYWIIGDAGRELSGSAWQHQRALNVLNRIVNTFDRDNVDESVAKCREIAREFIGNKVDSADVYGKKPTDEPTNINTATVWAFGNCHIDTAWLWPFAETHRKIARSWASQLDLLERYPEYVFAASQAQQFEWLLQDHPKLFERVREAVTKGGRFIPIGGSWVESDTNMPSGESLAHQLLLGQTFFEKHFGKRSTVYWLPDTFGYAPQLPQICRLAGMNSFLTQKLSWNNINVFPHSTFNWVGLDTSQVVCHMPPDNTYTAEAHFGDVRRSLEQHKNLDVDQHGMLLYGHGDGGGGPTAEMIEKLRRARGLSDTVGELPRVHQGSSVDEFFDAIRKSTDDGKQLVSWVGELYLEYHRGTYTTQAAIKRGNRKSETLLYDLELLATEASLQSKDYKYPYDEIEALWKDVCLNQFHDVLPGSGIAMVYDDARAIYAKIEKNGSDLIQKAFAALGYTLKPERGWYWNSLQTPVPTRDLAPTEQKKDKVELVNERFKLVLEDGVIVSLYDKKVGRQVLAKGAKAGVLALFEDQPLNFPAWDTEQYATEKRRDLVAHKVVVNPKSVVAHYETGKSRFTVEIQLLPDLVNFSVQAEWHEDYQILKAEFPVDIVATEASYETAFGHHKRPTHWNTSWDAAKFEVCGHRYADLSEYGYGVALLNDSKYGYSIHGNTMRLTLLRSPKNPDPNADMGSHTFKFALMPHEGPLGPAVVHRAEHYNHQLYFLGAASSTKGAPSLLPVRLHKTNSVVVSTIKRARKDQAGKNLTQHVIVRLYESMGGRASNILMSPHHIQKATVVNLLEDEEEELPLRKHQDSNVVPVTLKPFEVLTVRLDLAGRPDDLPADWDALH